MIRQLLEEVKAAPLDEASRNRLKDIHQASIKELEAGSGARAGRGARAADAALHRGRHALRGRAADRPGPAGGLARGALPRHPDRDLRPADGGPRQLEQMREALPPGMHAEGTARRSRRACPACRPVNAAAPDAPASPAGCTSDVPRTPPGPRARRPRPAAEPPDDDEPEQARRGPARHAGAASRAAARRGRGVLDQGARRGRRRRRLDGLPGAEDALDLGDPVGVDRPVPSQLLATYGGASPRTMKRRSVPTSGSPMPHAVVWVAVVTVRAALHRALVGAGGRDGHLELPVAAGDPVDGADEDGVRPGGLPLGVGGLAGARGGRRLHGEHEAADHEHAGQQGAQHPGQRGREADGHARHPTDRPNTRPSTAATPSSSLRGAVWSASAMTERVRVGHGVRRPGPLEQGQVVGHVPEGDHVLGARPRARPPGAPAWSPW